MESRIIFNRRLSIPGVAYFFFFITLPTFSPKNLGSYEEKSYLCRRKVALGKLKASFLCARLHFLCHRIAIKKKLWDIKKIL